MTIQDDALHRIIAQYTREAGVRSLERQIGAVARKIAARVAGADPKAPLAMPVLVGGADVRTTSARHGSTTRCRSACRGLASPLAWRGRKAAVTCCSLKRA